MNWIEADVTADWTTDPVDIWHDRAVFHFLTGRGDRLKYREHLVRALRPGGSAIIATFGPEGPKMCSGLPTMQYSPEDLLAELGHGFDLRDTYRELHRTPSGATQEFWYSRFTRQGA